MRLSEMNVANQEMALVKLYELVLKAVKSPLVRETAIQMVEGCTDRDDKCELEAIFAAVKSGNPNVDGFAQGVKYITDPEMYTDDGKDTIDHYTTPQRLIEQCKRGICAEDCDGHSALVASLAGALGFQYGLRIYKPRGSKYFEHVYAVIAYPKLEPTKVLAMDTTVHESYVGWEPQDGEVLTATVCDDLKRLIGEH